MNIDLGTGELCLSDNQPIRLRRAKGIFIHCLEGNLWITVQGIPGDTHLAAGEAYRIQGNGLALVESIGSGRLKIVRNHGKFQISSLLQIGQRIRAMLSASNVRDNKRLA
jgi:hypothetical protein